MKHKVYIYAHLAVILFAALPIISVLLASLGSSIVGCENLNEGSEPDCLGGGLWYTMFVMGWFALVTIPLGVAALSVTVSLHLIMWFVHWRKHH